MNSGFYNQKSMKKKLVFDKRTSFLWPCFDDFSKFLKPLAHFSTTFVQLINQTKTRNLTWKTHHYRQSNLKCRRRNGSFPSQTYQSFSNYSSFLLPFYWKIFPCKLVCSLKPRKDIHTSLMLSISNIYQIISYNLKTLIKDYGDKGYTIFY